MGGNPWRKRRGGPGVDWLYVDWFHWFCVVVMLFGFVFIAALIIESLLK